MVYIARVKKAKGVGGQISRHARDTHVSLS